MTTYNLALFMVQKASLKEIPGLITNSYIFAAVCAVVFILLAMLIANMIKFEGGTNPSDPKKRRVWFWIMAIVTPVVFYLYNLFLVIPNIKKGPAMEKFALHGALSALAACFVYIILGFIMAKVFKRGKIGNWFPAKK
ncbi:hypothetical protein N9W69_02540 [Flavobacteriaceae bacterium]|nr:hypothetical protein [Flavobacteriaceae bacterium]